MKKKFILFAILCLLISQNLSAAKKQKVQTEDELSLFEIDRLIRATEYDEALKQLKVYIENNPLKFDLAQQRIKKIMNARRSYSELAEKLIELIKNDPGNNKEIYEITSQLEQFEKHPSDENLKFIADAKKSAEFNYFRSLFLELQTESARLTMDHKFTEGAAKAKEGFWLYKDSFYEEWADNPEIINSVSKVLAEVDQIYAAYSDNAYQKKLNEALNNFIKAVENDDYEDALEKYYVCVNVYSPLATQIRTLEKNTQTLSEIFEQTKQINPDLTDASFIPFVTRFINGAPGVSSSGVNGALKGQWNYLITSMDGVVTKNLEKHFNNYSSPFGNSVFDNLGAVEESFQNTPDSEYKKLTEAVDLNRKLSTLDGKVNNQSVIYLSKISDECIEMLSGKMNSLIKVAVQINPDNLFENPQNIISEIAGINTITGSRSDFQIDETAWYMEYKKNELSQWDSFGDKYKLFVDELFATSLRLSLQGWTVLEDFYSKKNEEYIKEAQQKVVFAETFEKGVNPSLSQETHTAFLKTPAAVFDYLKNSENNSESDILYKYPDISFRLAESVQKELKENQKNIDNMRLSLMNNYNQYEEFKENQDITEIIQKTNEGFINTKNKLQEYYDLLAASGERCQNSIINSQIAQNEADFRFTEAQQALRKDQFDIARKKLQEALAKYDEALNLQNDLSLRTACDAKLMELGNQITKAENEIIVREVRALKTQAKDAYFNGRFEDAEKLLTQAKNRWAVTNVEEDEEINNLMNYVNNAIAMQTGREIPPSAPLYPEMSQLLNIAYQYYNEGEKNIKAGKKKEGEEALDFALDNLQKLQFVYPINQEASILTLKINQLKDPKKFAEEFDQKIAAARVMCKNKETQQTGYSNLKDYQALQPGYKGLADLIYQIEIDIGIRQKKVQNTDVQRAKNLVKDGQNLFNKAGNDVEKLKVALERVNQAIKLNPDNQEAMILKDKITTKIGGNTITVLSTEDESLYQIAVKKLQNNDIIGANVIARQLLAKPQNGSIKKVRELKNKIDARL